MFLAGCLFLASGISNLVLHFVLRATQISLDLILGNPRQDLRETLIRAETSIETSSETSRRLIRDVGRQRPVYTH
jgi:hypothetical protein